jgi:hypothetical protein
MYHLKKSFFLGIVFVRSSTRGVQKRHKKFLGKAHVKNFWPKKLREKGKKLFSCRLFPTGFFIAFLAVSLHEEPKNTTKLFSVFQKNQTKKSQKISKKRKGAPCDTPSGPGGRVCLLVIFLGRIFTGMCTALALAPVGVGRRDIQARRCCTHLVCPSIDSCVSAKFAAPGPGQPSMDPAFSAKMYPLYLCHPADTRRAAPLVGGSLQVLRPLPPALCLNS